MMHYTVATMTHDKKKYEIVDGQWAFFSLRNHQLDIGAESVHIP